MRDKTPLQWIEAAERKRVLSPALFERTADPGWCKAAQDAVSVWLPQMRSWLAPSPTTWLHARAVPVPAVSARPVGRRADDRSYRCEW